MCLYPCPRPPPPFPLLENEERSPVLSVGQLLFLVIFFNISAIFIGRLAEGVGILGGTVGNGDGEIVTQAPKQVKVGTGPVGVGE